MQNPIPGWAVPSSVINSHEVPAVTNGRPPEHVSWSGRSVPRPRLRGTRTSQPWTTSPAAPVTVAGHDATFNRSTGRSKPVRRGPGALAFETYVAVDLGSERAHEVLGAADRRNREAEATRSRAGVAGRPEPRNPHAAIRNAQGPRPDMISATALRGRSLLPPHHRRPGEPVRGQPRRPRPSTSHGRGRPGPLVRCGPVSATLIRRSRTRRCKPVAPWSPGQELHRFGLHSLWGRHSSGGLHSLQPQARWWWCLCRGGTQTFQMSPMVVSSR
jgi:hypothetical protein